MAGATALLVACVTLVVIFWPGSPPTEVPDEVQAVYTVTRRPFRTAVTLESRIDTSPAIEIERQRPASEVEWNVSGGDRVEAGQTIGWELPPTPGARAEAEASLDAAQRQRDRQRQTADLDIAEAQAVVDAAENAEAKAVAERELARVKLDWAQILDDLDLEIARLERVVGSDDVNRLPITTTIAGTVQIAEGVARVFPDGLIVTATIDPLVLYRLLDPDGRPVAESAVVKVTGVDVQFDCGGLAFKSETRTDEVVNVATCGVPAGTRVFAGLKATLAITTADLSDALVVNAAGVRPALDGSDQAVVTVLHPDGRTSTRTVTTGPTDGLSVVIISGLSEGEQVLDVSATG